MKSPSQTEKNEESGIAPSATKVRRSDKCHEAQSEQTHSPQAKFHQNTCELHVCRAPQLTVTLPQALLMVLSHTHTNCFTDLVETGSYLMEEMFSAFLSDELMN